MPRRKLELAVTAAQGGVADGERVVVWGRCWAARRRRFVPLVLSARRRVLLLVTDRRLLVFARPRRRPLRARDLLLGKRFETYRLEGVRRARPLWQVRVATDHGARLVFEFGPRRRGLATAVTDRLRPSPGPPAGPADAGPDPLDARIFGEQSPSPRAAAPPAAG
jgi:hypothetical protein